ncbi:MAG TPA: hypothetical protein VGK53_13645 [Propionicimonas sp.]
MKAVPTIIATTAALVVGGGWFAVQASADPATPAPRPADTASTAGGAGGGGVGWFFTVLTDVQRSCLADAGLQRPAGKLTPDQVKDLRSAIDAALAKCEVTVPARVAGRDRLGFRWAALTAEQQQCLADVRLTRPVGRLTADQRAAVRQAKLDAVKACVTAR